MLDNHTEKFLAELNSEENRKKLRDKDFVLVPLNPCTREYLNNTQFAINSDGTKICPLETGIITDIAIPDNPDHYCTYHYKGKQYRVHILVALAYLGCPDTYFKDVQVNHINSNKHDNRVDNLEWVTPRQNRIHSVTTCTTDQAAIVDVYDIITKGTTRYPSIGIAAKAIGVSKSLFHHWFEHPFKVRKGRYVIKRATETFPLLSAPQYQEAALNYSTYLATESNNIQRTRVFVVVDNTTNVQTPIAGITYLASFLGIPKSLLLKYLDDKLLPSKYPNYDIVEIEDDTEYTLYYKRALDRRETTHIQTDRASRIRVTNTRTKQVTEYNNTQEFANTQPVKRKSIQKAMSVNKFTDGRKGGRFREYEIEYLD